MGNRVSVDIKDHVAEVMLSRPDKYNALDVAMFAAISDAIDEVAADKTVRVVVLHGAGKNFCSGIDISVLADRSLDFRAALVTPLEPSPANIFQKVAYGWRELKVPVICALHGITFGGGLQIALGADLRIAAANSQLSIMESKWGLVPDMALTTTLRDLVGPDQVKELAWSGRVVAAEEALSLGLVTAIADDSLAASRKMAGEFANRSPQAMQGIKALVNRSWQMSDAAALSLEAELQLGIMGSKNQIEAVQANSEGRQPVFQDI